MKNSVKTNLVFLVLLFAISACGSNLEKAREHYRLHEYDAAAQKFEQLLKGDKLTKIEKQDIAFQAGEAYRLNHDSKNALKMYAKAIAYGRKDPVVHFRKAEMLMQQQLYGEALQEFIEYKKNNPADPDVDRMIQGCELALGIK